jgi:hypothetical protein
MRVDLSDRQRSEHRDQGKITGADERGYSHRGTKTKRRVCDELLASGAPLVLDMYSSGQFEWFDGQRRSRSMGGRPPLRHHGRPHEQTARQARDVDRWNLGV